MELEFFVVLDGKVHAVWRVFAIGVIVLAFVGCGAIISWFLAQPKDIQQACACWVAWTVVVPQANKLRDVEKPSLPWPRGSS